MTASTGETMVATAPAPSALADRWGALSALHGRIEAHTEHALRSAHRLSVREFSLLEVLSRQQDGAGGGPQMKEVADAVALSQSATTRLVTRLEERGLLARRLCPTDGRGVCTEVSPAGRELLAAARPTNSAALREALEQAAADPRLAWLVAAVERPQAPAP